MAAPNEMTAPVALMAAPARIPTLFIGGSGRSGSTILGRLLGQMEGVTFVGELDLVWQQGLIENRLCGCGASFMACAFWREVGRTAFGGWDAIDLDEIRGVEEAIGRHRHLPLSLAPGISGRYARALQVHSELMSGLFAAIRTVDRSSLIVDSSKFPVRAYLLRHVETLDLRMIHLVRDARAVAFSWAKKVSEPGVPYAQAYMRRIHPARSAAHWMAFNALCHPLERLGVPTMFMRYESFIQEPAASLARALEHAGTGGPWGDLSFLEDGAVDLAADHSIAGNPMRFTTGKVTLRNDDEWQRRMRPTDRSLVSVLTYPMLRAYGYVAPDDVEDEHPRIGS